MTIDIHLENPKLNFDDITLKNIAILVGPNGTGKTMILLNFFTATTIANFLITGKMFDASSVRTLETAQFVYDTTFNDQNFTGAVKVTFDNNIFMSVVLNNGKVTSVEHNLHKDLKLFPSVRYMSTDIRSFDNISLYLRLRKTVTKESGTNDLIILGEMLKNYKLPDVTYLELLIKLVPYSFTPRDKEILLKYGVEKVDSINVDLDLCDFYFITTDTNEKKYLKSYGKGHQSIVNIYIGSII